MGAHPVLAFIIPIKSHEIGQKMLDGIALVNRYDGSRHASTGTISLTIIGDLGLPMLA